MSKTGFKRMMRERSALSQSSLHPVQREVTKLTAEIAAANHYIAPTDEQLANFVCATANVMINEATRGASSFVLCPRAVELMLRDDPRLKSAWLQRHREFGDAVLASVLDNA